jgi:hypothetical protein
MAAARAGMMSLRVFMGLGEWFRLGVQRGLGELLCDGTRCS